MKLIQANIDTIERLFAERKRDGKREAIFFDDQLKGFGLRCQGEQRTWIVQYRIGFKQRRVSLGAVAVLSASDARKMAKDKLADVTKGNDPQLAKIEERAAAKVTLRSVIDLYLAAHQAKLRPGSLYELRRYLLKYWDTLHRLPIDKIEQKFVAARLREIENGSARLRKIKNSNGRVTAAHARTALSCLFTWAMREGLCQANPVTNTHNPGKGIEPRNRVLDDSELAAVWNACRDDDFGRIIRLLILSGQRMREVGGMAWAELDDDNAKWSIPGDRTKNKRDHELILPAAAWAIIAKVPRRTNPNLFGRSKRGFAGYPDGKALLDQRCKLAHWTIHDIRRTVATGMADLGIQPHIIEQVLNHQSGHKRGVAGIYNRSSYQREVKTALALWSDHITSITSGEESKIIPLQKA